MRAVQVNLKFPGVGIWASSYPCGQSKFIWSSMGLGFYISYPCGKFEVPWGWERWYHLIHAGSPSQFEVPWGGNFGIILSLWTVQVNLKFYRGGNFDIILSMRAAQVNLKFHGIILSLWTVQVHLKFHGIGILYILSLWKVWSSMGVGTLISPDPCGQSKSIWSCMAWEFWYHLILVDSPSSFEVPRGW